MRNLFFYLFFMSISLTQIPLSAQILKDEAAKQLSSQILNNIYNFNFTHAKNQIEQLEKKYAKHPVIPFLRAYLISWQYLPLEKSMPQFTYYNQYLQLSVNYAKKRVDASADDLEGNYFLMMTYGLLAMFEAESGDFMQSVGYGKKSYSYMKKGFGQESNYPDFHFSSGLYKYYAVQYPETHPIAKPFMIFFPGGNKTQGLWHFQQAAQFSQFSKTESKIYMASIYAKYEKNFVQFLNYAQQLINQYPRNPFFWTKYCEALIHVGRYAEAEIYLPRFNSHTENMYASANHLFKGIIQEKYYKSDIKAEAFYKKVVQAGKYDKKYTIDYYAFAYAGLARIAHRKSDTKSAKDHYKNAKKIAQYESLITEIDTYLASH